VTRVRESIALLAAALVAVAWARPAEGRDIPALSGPVVDAAALLDAGGRRRLEALCRAAWEQAPEHRVQLQYLIIPSLDGEDVEGFSTRVFEAWKLGDRGRDNGILVVVARDDRRVRIETGYGNEGALTDAQASRIIRGTIAPSFREGRYGEGLFQAGVQILSALGALPQDAGRRMARPNPLHGLGAALVIVVALLFVVGRLFSGFGPSRRRFWYGGLGGPWGGGWGGGGGWSGGGGGGGGGWSGGGGSSGGGGASGSW
jgi:uncharacterized protein